MTRRILLMLWLSTFIASAQQNSGETRFATLTNSARKLDGFQPLYWDERSGKIWLEIDRFNQEFLYVISLSAGVGSNDLGLDRGRMGEPKVVEFERSGPRVLLVQNNYSFRASGGDMPEKRAETDSFARSVLWGFDVAAEDGPRVLVDATSFLLRDAVGVADDLTKQKQGNYHFDLSRSAFDMNLTKSFPRNTEVETTITVTGSGAGKYVSEVTPTPEAVTVREHQAFVASPPPGYQPRLQDPRAGYSSVDFMDFSTPVDQPVVKRYIARHRLQKKNPGAAMSDPVEPLVYYIDGGAPEPIRSALQTGASWWNQAFEAAGFHNAFQVKILPPDVDPMDVRYNVVQWVHRSTRGWSYGNSLVDPRTGEIVKGIVTLGSLRARQDFLIFQGLMAPYGEDGGGTGALTDAVYARLRQLAAHEVGHTLGLEHNFLASTEGRASVMDYPGPLVQVKGNKLDLSDAYAVGIGAWDKVSIRWGYSEFTERTHERAQLDQILTDAAKHGLTFITDADSRPLGGAHPKAHLWDSGKSSSDELDRILRVRSVALSHFGVNNIPQDTPMATLDEVLVPLYFMHRFQVEATAKVLGGNDYTYALRGDGETPTQIVPAAEQMAALQELLKTISPDTLTIPERILKLIPPRPPGYMRTRETFPNQTGVTFDPIAGAEAAANLTVGLILNPERAARLEQYHARDSANPSFSDVLDALVSATWSTKVPAGLQGEVAKTVRYVVVEQMMRLAGDESTPMTVKAVINNRMARMKDQDEFASKLISSFERDPKSVQLPAELQLPPGQPIGEEDGFFFR